MKPATLKNPKSKSKKAASPQDEFGQSGPAGTLDRYEALAEEIAGLEHQMAEALGVVERLRHLGGQIHDFEQYLTDLKSSATQAERQAAQAQQGLDAQLKEVRDRADRLFQEQTQRFHHRNHEMEQAINSQQSSMAQAVQKVDTAVDQAVQGLDRCFAELADRQERDIEAFRDTLKEVREQVSGAVVSAEREAQAALEAFEVQFRQTVQKDLSRLEDRLKAQQHDIGKNLRQLHHLLDEQTRSSSTALTGLQEQADTLSGLFKTLEKDTEQSMIHLGKTVDGRHREWEAALVELRERLKRDTSSTRRLIWALVLGLIVVGIPVTVAGTFLAQRQGWLQSLVGSG